MSEGLADRSGAAFHAPVGDRTLVWRRFRRERVAVAALAALILIVSACFVLEPLLEWVLGHGPDTPFPHAVYGIDRHPVGPFSVVPNDALGVRHGNTLLLLGGADGPLGRDELMRLLAGGRVSLEIAFIATAIALLVGVVLGTAAGYFGGAIDAAISRLTELFMAFPLLLLVIALGQTTAQRFASYTLHGLFQPGVLALSIVIGLFCWFYPARVTRTLVVSLREQEFVEAARMIGARDARVIRKHLLPHLSGPLIVWGTIVAAGVIVLEASLSVLGFGVRLRRLPPGAARASIVTHVDRIELGLYGWRVHASISNRSASPLPIENVEKPPLPGATAGPQAYPRQPTSLLVRGPDQFGGTILQVHAATDYQPQLPRVLRPHQMWRGTFAGVGKVPSGALFYAGFGQFESNGQLISISSAKSATAP